MTATEYNIQKRRNLYASRFRIQYPNAFYHLIQRAPGKEKLFINDNDYLYMLSLIKQAASKFKWKVFSFVLMSNHIHLLIQITEENLSRGTKFIFENYAMYFNKKYGRKGPVFCKPYRAFLCQNDAYLFAISLYIHLNPYKSGLVKYPEKYKWSSVNLYSDDKNPKTFLDYGFILSLLGEDRTNARKIYVQLLQEAGNLQYKSLLDEPQFIRKFCLQTIKLKLLFINKNVRGKRDIENELQDFVDSRYSKNIPSQKIKSNLIVDLKNRGYSVIEISQLTNVSRQHIYRYLRNVTKQASPVL